MKKIIFYLGIIFLSINVKAGGFLRLNDAYILDGIFQKDNFYFVYLENTFQDNSLKERLVVSKTDKKFKITNTYKTEEKFVTKELLLSSSSNFKILASQKLVVIYNTESGDIYGLDSNLKPILTINKKGFIKLALKDESIYFLYNNKLEIITKDKTDSLNFTNFFAEDFLLENNLKVVGKDDTPALLNIESDGYITYKVTIEGESFRRIIPLDKYNLVLLDKNKKSELLIYTKNDILNKRKTFDYIKVIQVSKKYIYLVDSDNNLIKLDYNLKEINRTKIQNGYQVFIDNDPFIYNSHEVKILDDDFNIKKTQRFDKKINALLSNDEQVIIRSDDNFYELVTKERGKLDYLIFLMFMGVLGVLFKLNSEDRHPVIISRYQKGKK